MKAHAPPLAKSFLRSCVTRENHRIDPMSSSCGVMQGSAPGEFVVTAAGTQVIWKTGSKYIIDGFIGAGNYGQVARARAVDSPDQTVVIKRTANAFRVSDDASAAQHCVCVHV